MSAKRSFEAALDDLRGEERPARASLQGLSDLGDEQVRRLLAAWPHLTAGRRLWIVQTLDELAEDNFELDFSAVFKAVLGDVDPRVRRAAIEGLWESDAPEVATALLAILATDPQAEVRAAAASALGHYVFLAEMQDLPADTAGLVRDALLATIRSDELLEVRRRAVEAIGFLSNDEEVRQVIERAYAEEQPAMRTSAVFAMGRNCDVRWLPNLLNELHSDNPELRFEAARACGELEDRRAVPELLKLLIDPDLEVRLAAIQALGEIGGEQAVEALRYVAQGGDAAAAEAAAEALAEAEFAESPLSFGLEEGLRGADEPGGKHEHDH